MTGDEFLALKEGDRIDNAMSHTRGTVTGITYDRRGQRDGVTIQWDGTALGMARHFTKYTTAWMHWEKLM